MTRKYLFLAPLLALLCTATNAQKDQKPLVPVACKVPNDSPIPKRDTTGKVTYDIPEAKALEIERAGRKQPGFLSIPEPENFGVVRFRLEEYAKCTDKSHCYWTDLQSQLDEAKAELRRLVATRKGDEKLAMVLDIDETSLSGYCELMREGFGHFPAQYDPWAVSSDASIPIPGTVDLYNEALAQKVSVFFITGRPGSQLDATIANLHLAGYDHWAGLILRNKDELDMDTTKYKSSERKKQIVDEHYRIILSVGDQWSDLNGDPAAEVSVKLPNPFYFLP